MKAPNVSGWQNKVVYPGLLIILINLCYLLTQYCNTCNPIHNTSIGKPLGIPLAAYGMVFTIALLAAYIKNRKLYSYGISIAFVVSIMLIYAQAVVFHRYCVYCLICEAIYIILWLIEGKYAHRLATVGLMGLLLGVYIGTNYAVAQLTKVDTHVVEAKTINSSENKFKDTVVYSWEEKPTLIEAKNKNDIMLVALWCDHCKDTLAKFSPKDWEHTIVIDIAMENNIQKEKELWQSIPGINTNRIFFDVDKHLFSDYLPRIYPAAN